MDLRLYLSMFMCYCLSAQVHACICVYQLAFMCMPIFVLAHLVRCYCRHSVKHVPRWRAPVCRLSVWRWRHHGLSRRLGSEVWKETESERGIHACIHPYSPVQTTNQEQRDQEGGEGEEGGGWEGETQKERETIWVWWKCESDIYKSLQALWGPLACLHSPGREKGSTAYFPASRQWTMPL